MTHQEIVQALMTAPVDSAEFKTAFDAFYELRKNRTPFMSAEEDEMFYLEAVAVWSARFLIGDVSVERFLSSVGPCRGLEVLRAFPLVAECMQYGSAATFMSSIDGTVVFLAIEHAETCASCSTALSEGVKREAIEDLRRTYGRLVGAIAQA